MEFDTDECREIFEKLPNSKLLSIFVNDWEQYEQKAIEIIKTELRKRNIEPKYVRMPKHKKNPPRIALIRPHEQSEDPTRNIQCPYCQKTVIIDDLRGGDEIECAYCYENFIIWEDHTKDTKKYIKIITSNRYFQKVNDCIIAGSVSAESIHIHYLEKYPFIRQVKPEWWDFVLLIACTFVALNLLKNENISGQDIEAVSGATIYALTIKYPDFSFLFMECSESVSQNYSKLAARSEYKVQSVHFIFDSLGLWIADTLSVGTVPYAEEKEMIRELGEIPYSLINNF